MFVHRMLQQLPLSEPHTEMLRIELLLFSSECLVLYRIWSVLLICTVEDVDQLFKCFFCRADLLLNGGSVIGGVS